MSHRDRNNRKPGISDSNRHNKYNHTNKWKNNHWTRNFNNYGGNNYRNSDYGPSHSDNRYNSNWIAPPPSPWENDWFNQHQNFANSNYSANNFNINSGIGVNFSRSNRSKNLKEKIEFVKDIRTDNRQLPYKSRNESGIRCSVEKTNNLIEKSTKDAPSTITSSSNSQPSSSQSYSSNFIEKISDPSTPKQQPAIENSAEEATKKLIHQLTSMNKHNLKQMINNPSSKYETALQTHARNRMRAEMRTKLQNMSSHQEYQLVNNVLDTEECIDMDKIPDNVFDEIGRVLDINLLGQEDNLTKKYNDNDDKDKEQIAYPEDLFLRAEKLLMENSILFLEDRDSVLSTPNDRDEDRAPILRIKNEIKEEPDDIGDENFLEIQEAVSDNYSLPDLVFEDRGSSLSLRNDNFVEQLNEMSDKSSTFSENNQNISSNENREEIVIVKQEIDLHESPSELHKSPDPARPVIFPPICINQTQTISTSNLKKESHYDAEVCSNKSASNISAEFCQISKECHEPPKRNDLFTKLQNSGAFDSTSTRRRADKIESLDNKKDSLYSRKKKKKHKSRSRSISRQRSCSRSKSRNRNSHRSKKQLSHDHSRRNDTTAYLSNDSTTSKEVVDETQLISNVSFLTIDRNDEISQKHDRTIKELTNAKNNIDTEILKATGQEVMKNQIVDSNINEPQIEEDPQYLPGSIASTAEYDIDNQNESVLLNLNEQISNSVSELDIAMELDLIDDDPIAQDITNINIAEVILPPTTCLDSSKAKNEAENTPKDVTESIGLGDESCTSLSSNLAETNSITLTSESQSSILDDPTEVYTNSSPSQISNAIGVKKTESRSTSSRHQRNNNLTSSSKHKCEKERHTSTSSKNKKSVANSASSKRTDHKDNSITSSSTAAKHQSSKNEHLPQRVWRSAGEKKCIEPTSVKSTLRSINIFDQVNTLEPAKSIETLKSNEPTKTAIESTNLRIEPTKVSFEPTKLTIEPSNSIEQIKSIEPVKSIEPKSSSQRKDNGKSHTRTNKSPVTQYPKNDTKKSCAPSKKISYFREKNNLSHRHLSGNSDKLSSHIEPFINTHPYPSHLLTDSLKIMSDNNNVLQRMKDIDLKLMEVQVKKTFIDEQIHNLHKEKNVIDQTTMRLQNERFLLLSSLLTTNAVNVISQKKGYDPPFSTREKDSDHNIVVVSSDEETKISETKRTARGKLQVSKSLKRRIQEDVKCNVIDAKCKKVKINISPIKSLVNYKNKIKIEDSDEAQSDLTPNEVYTTSKTRLCSVRLTRLSSKRIKIMATKSAVESDVTNDAICSTTDVLNNKCGILFGGIFSGHTLPIVHLQVVDGFLIAASEDSNVYKFDLLTGRILSTFAEHTKTVSNFIATENNRLYSVSLDGCLKKFYLQNFSVQTLSINIGEALQVMDYAWDTAYIGSRIGKIYILDTKVDVLSDECLCSVGKSIMAIKATKEGPRKILIVSSRCHNINIRDAVTGLLLRIIEVPDKLTIYSIHLEGGQLYCGTNKNLVFRYEFTSGIEISRIKLGTGTICLKSYKNSIILGGCYDGYIYAYDTKNEIQLSRFSGPGKMLLHFDVYNDKVIATAKDKSLRFLEIPDDIVSHKR